MPKITYKTYDDKTYTIERKSTKYTKRLKGEETQEAKTELNFEVYDPVMGETTSLNGLTRTLTDANIRKHFGTLDDFSVSSLSSQHGALSFIDEGSTRRKEIIAKFLDLELFERKFKLAKEDSVDLKGALKRLESRNYDEEIDQSNQELSTTRTELAKQQEKCTLLKESLEILTTVRNDTQAKIDSIPAEVIDINAINDRIRAKENTVMSLKLSNQDNEDSLKIKQGVYKKIIHFLDEFELQKYQGLKETIESIRNKLSKEEDNLDRLLDIHNDILKKQKLLEEHEYDPDCEYCSNNEFVKEAHAAVANKTTIETQQKETLEVINGLSTHIKSLNPSDVESQLERYNKIEANKHTVSSEIADLNLDIEKNKNTIHTTENELDQLRIKRDEYEENKEAIENLESLIIQLNKCHYDIKKTNQQITTCENKTLEFVKNVGSLEQKVENIISQKNEYRELQREYAAYDLYMQCMHSNGIAYDIIKKKIPVINSEIAKVLANIVDFEVFFEASGNKFDIFIKHPRYNERPIEMASGAEKSLSAIAIRLALLGVSSLPTGDIFVLDEPGTALDEENMEGFIRILELIKVYFKNVLLISHLDSLKDAVDMQIVIDKKAGYAKVNQ